jgi:hypothetical protein
LIKDDYMMNPENYSNAIAYAFEAVGGLGAASKACQRSNQALNKWRKAACLPRTDYTGETEYARLLAEAAKLKGNSFEASWLLKASSPYKASV